MTTKSLLLTTAIALTFAFNGAAIAADAPKAEAEAAKVADKGDAKVDAKAKKHHHGKHHKKSHKKHHDASTPDGILHDGDLANPASGVDKDTHHKGHHHKKHNEAKHEEMKKEEAKPMTQDTQGPNKTDKK